MVCKHSKKVVLCYATKEYPFELPSLEIKTTLTLRDYWELIDQWLSCFKTRIFEEKIELEDIAQKTV